MNIKTFSTDNGLSINTVNALQFDKNGYLWIATSDGLQRYDGYGFKTFKHNENDSSSLASNEVYDLYLDDDENLWITGREYISVKRKHRFDFINLNKRIPYLSNKNLFVVSEDETTVALLQVDYGIFYINKKTLKTDSIYKKQLPSLSALMKEQNRVAYFSWLNKKFKTSWIQSKDSLFYFHNKQIDVFSVPKAYKKQNCHVFSISKDSLLVIGKSSYISLVSNPFVPVKALKTNGVTPNLWTVYIHTFLGNNEILLLGKDGADILVNTATASITKFSFAKDIHKVAGNAIASAAVKDDFGNLWLGFNGRGGMVMVKKNKGKLKNIYVNKELMPYSVYKHTNGNIYCSGFRNNIFVFNEEGILTEKIFLPKETESRSVRGISKLDSNNLVLKFCESNIYVYNLLSKKFISLHNQLPLLYNTEIGVFNFNICTQEVNIGEVLFNYDRLIYSVKKTDTRFYIQKLYEVPDNVHWFCINDKHSWIATKNVIYDYKNGTKKIVQFPDYVYIKCITEDKNGRLWVATTTGIYIVSNNKIMHKIDESTGLKNNFVYGILFDKNNNAWISTNKGLAVIFPDYSVRTFSKEQGVLGDEFNTGCFYKAPDDMMYFAGINGITFFNPEKVLQPTKDVSVVLNSIEVKNTVWKPDVAPESLSEINLRHNENVINLSFGINDFTSPQYNTFKIQLTYPNGKTSLAANNNVAQFILAPGKYLVTVWGMGHEGLWSKKPLILHLNIQPTWYQTWWFKVLAAVCVILLALWLLYFILTRKQRKQIQQLILQQQVQQEKEKLSRDLHDNLGSQLTLLINNVNLLKPQQPDINNAVKEVKQNASSMLQSLRQIIWIMNHESISLSAFTDKIIEYAFKYVKAFSEIELNIEREQHEKEQQLVSSDIVMQLFPVMQEALTNACKHSKATIITLGFTCKQDCFEFYVTDNGKGFVVNNAGSDESFGLKNMKNRAAAINSNFIIESIVGKGTRVLVQVASLNPSKGER
ncbi:MAG: hypothetical protein KF781_02260 [Chitinophagaceae bacterium]|nr:hypothetical protein [Chitinophagaceae bacterium]MCW5904333.1 hypothetical protein [Chitinophagaceae bacterium]